MPEIIFKGDASSCYLEKEMPDQSPMFDDVYCKGINETICDDFMGKSEGSSIL